MPYPEDMRYTREHEWVRMEDALAVIGVTEHAQDQLGDIVFVDLPDEGATVAQFAKFGEIESVKAVSDLFAPLSGDVVEVNTRLDDEPELVNDSPHGEGWMLKMRPSQPSELEALLTAAAYERYLAEESGG